MKSCLSTVIIVALLMGFATPQAPAFADISRSNLIPIARALSRDFSVVNSIRTIEMGDIGERTDVVVIGGTEGPHGWRAEVLTVDRHEIRKIWDSAVSAQEQEFGNSGPGNIEVNVEDGTYDLIIEGCVPHECSNGIFGFLIYYGQSGKTAKAKVVSHVNSLGGSEKIRYDVTYSIWANTQERRDLQKLICNSGSNEISNKAGFPFSCAKTP